MTTARTIGRLDRLIWILIYVGLFMLALGIATGERDLVVGWSLGVLGTIAGLIGFFLIWVRSRMRVDADSASHTATNDKGQP